MRSPPCSGLFRVALLAGGKADITLRCLRIPHSRRWRVRRRLCLAASQEQGGRQADNKCGRKGLFGSRHGCNSTSCTKARAAAGPTALVLPGRNEGKVRRSGDPAATRALVRGPGGIQESGRESHFAGSRDPDRASGPSAPREVAADVGRDGAEASPAARSRSTPVVDFRNPAPKMARNDSINVPPGLSLKPGPGYPMGYLPVGSVASLGRMPEWRREYGIQRPG